MTKVIQARNISKRYLVHHEQYAMYGTLRESIARGVKNAAKALIGRGSSKIKPEEFWALKDISFDLEAGTKVGIIGRNGAGKSTLLKVLSRITYPTHGELIIKGRVSSLLEVGTGFHPELTGRENIYLNGAILGMTKKEIDGKFDEIVAFSELEKFLDSPVKHFSSGMTARLAFAVAAHLDPDVLIIDEVLSVGDVNFRDKCLNKMGQVSKEGRTVLFVSHNMNTVLSLCDRALYLEKGRLVSYDTVENIVADYMHQQASKQAVWQGSAGTRACQFTHAAIRDTDTDQIKDLFYRGDVVQVSLNYCMHSLAKDLVLGISVCTLKGQCLANAWLPPQHPDHPEAFSEGQKTIAFEFDSSIFYEGEYLIKVELKNIYGHVLCADEVVMRFSLYESDAPNCLEWDSPCVVLGSRWAVSSSVQPSNIGGVHALA